MGRHSAPQESSDESYELAAVAVAPPATRGRHARPDEDASAHAVVPFEDEAVVPFEDDELVPFEDPAPNGYDAAAALGTTEQPVALPATAQPRQRAREHATAADVALVRAHRDVRARVVAAVLVPFVIYTAVMAAISRLDRSYLLWIWIPLISAGVLVGVFLDLGHRKYDG